jgi:hypothetical protein
MIINKNDVYFDATSGKYYRIIDSHFSDFIGDYTDEMDEEGELTNWTSCFLTKHDVKRITGARTDIFEIEKGKEI